MNELLERVWYFDFEVFREEWLLVLESHKTFEKKIFRNESAYYIQDWIDENEPILVGYNSKGFDIYILKGILAGFDNHELHDLTKYIIDGNQGWQYNYGQQWIKTPVTWDLMNDIVPMKSLKEIEGNLQMSIVETTVPFDLPTAFTDEQYQEVLYYCCCDVGALRPLLEKRMDYFQAKYTICEMGGIDPVKGLSYTNANLTAVFLGATKKEHDDKHEYVYPENFELDKIPTKAKDYFDSFIRKEIDIDKEALPFELDGMRGALGSGGIHLALDNYTFESVDL